MSTPTIRAALEGLLAVCDTDESNVLDIDPDRLLDAIVFARDALAAEPVGEVGELVDRLGWIAAQLGDIGWSDDSASVARAATLLQQPSAPAPAVVPVAYDAGDDITIHRTRQEPEAWAVRRDLDCLALDGTWDHEPTPSDRTQEWLARHRFASAEAAAHAIPLPQANEAQP